VDVARPDEGTAPSQHVAQQSPDGPHGTPPEAAEAALRRLRNENFHLRVALRHRAVIEQAKGLLAARGEIDVDQAFSQLLRAARDTNRKLVDVAASYVAEVAAPPQAPGQAQPPLEEPGAGQPEEALTQLLVDDPSRRVPDELVAQLREHAARRHGPNPTPGAAALRLALAGIADATTTRELLASVGADCVWPKAPSQGTLWALQADGALELVASLGFARDDLSIWRRVPPVLRLPILAAAQGRTLFLDDAEQSMREFPDLAAAPSVSRRMAALPVSTAGHRFAVLHFGWDEPVAFTEDDRRSLRLLADGVADALLPMLTPATFTDTMVQAGLLMEAFSEPAVLVRPAVAGDGAPWVDVVVVEANHAAVAELTRLSGVPADPVGATLLEIAPWDGSAAVVEAVRASLQAGTATTVALADAEVRVSRWQDGAVLTWRREEPGVQAPPAEAGQAPAEAAEALLGTGALLVDLATGTATPSAGAQRLLRLDRSGSAPLPEALSAFSATARQRLTEVIGRVRETGTATTLRLALLDGTAVRVWVDRRERDGSPLLVLALARQRA